MSAKKQPGSGRIVIVGSGAAAAACLKALRESGYRGEIHLFTASRWPVYNPMLTTYYAAGKIGFDSLFPYGNSDAFYKQYRVNVHSGSPVVALDAAEKTVANQAGLELCYSQCLIASGASPFLPPVAGLKEIGPDKIYTMRTVEDAVRLREALAQKPRKVLVIGASMVGIKVAELFYDAGTAVCLADMAAHIFPLAAHPDCARLIEERLCQKGIKLRFGAAIDRVVETSGGIRAYFKASERSCGAAKGANSPQIPLGRESQAGHTGEAGQPGQTSGASQDAEDADLLVMCAGVRPNIGFIDRKQVAVGQGVLVDARMRTNAPGLYAAGDVAEGQNLLTGRRQIIGLWANARYQGRAAGRNMARAEGLEVAAEFYPGSIPQNITHFMGMDFAGIGDVEDYDRMEKTFDGQLLIQLFWREGRLIGANFLDTCAVAGIIKHALLRGLWQNRDALLCRQALFPLAKRPAAGNVINLLNGAGILDITSVSSILREVENG